MIKNKAFKTILITFTVLFVICTLTYVLIENHNGILDKFLNSKDRNIRIIQNIFLIYLLILILDKFSKVISLSKKVFILMEFGLLFILVFIFLFSMTSYLDFYSKYIQIVKVVGSLSIIVLMLLVGFISVELSFFFVLIGLYFIISFLVDSKDIMYQTLPQYSKSVTTFVYLYILLLVNNFALCIHIYNIKTKIKSSKKLIISLWQDFKILLYKIRVIIVIISYLFIVIVTLFSFAFFYENFNFQNANTKNGIFYSNNDTRIEALDPLYFSSTVFFTVGFGDIYPIGQEIKLLIQVEMIISHILSVIYIPMIIGFFLSQLQINSGKSSLDKNYILIRNESKN